MEWLWLAILTRLFNAYLCIRTAAILARAIELTLYEFLYDFMPDRVILTEYKKINTIITMGCDVKPIHITCKINNILQRLATGLRNSATG